MALVAECPYKHGGSAFIRDGLKMNNISVGEEDNVQLITVVVVVICLPRAMREKGVTPNFSSTTGGWSSWNTYLCVFLI